MIFKKKDVLAEIQSIEEQLKNAPLEQVDHLLASKKVWEGRLADTVEAVIKEVKHRAPSKPKSMIESEADSRKGK